MKTLATSLFVLATATLAGPTALAAQNAPTNLLPGGQDEDDKADADADDAVTSSPVVPSTATGPVEMTSEPVVQKFDPVVQQWDVAQAQALVEIAVEECDRFYPAFQFVLWGGKSPADALEAAMVDPAGEA